MANNMENIARKIAQRMFRKIRKIRFQLVFVEPEYWIRKSLCKDNIAVDCGIGDNADFSKSLIQKYGLKCYGFEPTRKHHAALDEVVERYGGLFDYHKFAISSTGNVRTFFESSENVSGSFLDDHVNVVHDSVVSYEVETITLDGLFDYLKVDRIDVLKLDIEGEEYEVLRTVADASLRKIGQFVVEFHHYCVEKYSKEDTRSIVHRMREIGFKSFTHDGKTYLFWSN